MSFDRYATKLIKLFDEWDVQIEKEVIEEIAWTWYKANKQAEESKQDGYRHELSGMLKLVSIISGVKFEVGFGLDDDNEVIWTIQKYKERIKRK